MANSHGVVTGTRGHAHDGLSTAEPTPRYGSLGNGWQTSPAAATCLWGAAVVHDVARVTAPVPRSVVPPVTEACTAEIYDLSTKIWLRSDMLACISVISQAGTVPLATPVPTTSPSEPIHSHHLVSTVVGRNRSATYATPASL